MIDDSDFQNKFAELRRQLEGQDRLEIGDGGRGKTGTGSRITVAANVNMMGEDVQKRLENLERNLGLPPNLTEMTADKLPLLVENALQREGFSKIKETQLENVNQLKWLADYIARQREGKTYYDMPSTDPLRSAMLQVVRLLGETATKPGREEGFETKVRSALTTAGRMAVETSETEEGVKRYQSILKTVIEKVVAKIQREGGKEATIGGKVDPSMRGLGGRVGVLTKRGVEGEPLLYAATEVKMRELGKEERRTTEEIFRDIRGLIELASREMFPQEELDPEATQKERVKWLKQRETNLRKFVQEILKSGGKFKFALAGFLRDMSPDQQRTFGRALEAAKKPELALQATRLATKDSELWQRFFNEAVNIDVFGIPMDLMITLAEKHATGGSIEEQVDTFIEYLDSHPEVGKRFVEFTNPYDQERLLKVQSIIGEMAQEVRQKMMEGGEVGTPEELSRETRERLSEVESAPSYRVAGAGYSGLKDIWQGRLSTERRESLLFDTPGRGLQRYFTDLINNISIEEPLEEISQQRIAGRMIAGQPPAIRREEMMEESITAEGEPNISPEDIIAERRQRRDEFTQSWQPRLQGYLGVEVDWREYIRGIERRARNMGKTLNQYLDEVEMATDPAFRESIINNLEVQRQLLKQKISLDDPLKQRMINVLGEDKFNRFMQQGEIDEELWVETTDTLFRKTDLGRSIIDTTRDSSLKNIMTNIAKMRTDMDNFELYTQRLEPATIIFTINQG